MRVRGLTFADALTLWLQKSNDYSEFIATPITLPIPLLAVDIVNIDVAGLSVRTSVSMRRRCHALPVVPQGTLQGT